MKTMFIRGGWGLLALAGLGGFARADEVSRLMGTVDQWLATREAIHVETTGWGEQKAALEQMRDLLDREKRLLEARLAETALVSGEAEEELVEIENRRQAREKNVRGVAMSLEEREGAWQAIRERFPEDVTSTGSTLSERLRTVFAAATAIQRRHQLTRVEPLLLDDPEGGRRQMDILFLGETQGYAVSGDDTAAAHGVWTGEVWQWTWNPTWARVIREAIRVHEGEATPRWVVLPVAVVDGEGR